MVAVGHTSTQKFGLVGIDKLRELLAKNKSPAPAWIYSLSDRELKEQLSRIAHGRIFMEVYGGDPSFREQIAIDPQKALAKYNLQVPLAEIPYLTASPSLQQKNTNSLLLSQMRDLWQVAKEKTDSIDELIGDRNYQMWRQRQINRCHSQMVKSLHNQVGHFPVAFELSKGCSVGCWFCSVSAPRLSDIFFYTPENAKLWREVLTMLQEVLGDAVAKSFCYWATDPLDNPDYERFLTDFQRILGKFPPITTAQPLKDLARTKKLLQLSLEKGCKTNRFSITSLKMLEKVLQEFTPEELTFVSFVQQQKEAGIPKANAGRMRERMAKYPDRKSQEVYDETVAGTNACVTGFLINMVDRTVKLITPCPASDRYPHGHRTYSEGTFDDAESLRTFVKQAIAIHMPLTVRDNDVVRFREDLEYVDLDDGFQLGTRMFTLKFRNNPYLKQLGEIILQGNKTVGEIIDLFQILGVSSERVRESLNMMFERGLLDI